MEGTHRKVGSRPFMPDPTLTCLCSALLGHIAKLGSITHPKQRRAAFVEAVGEGNLACFSISVMLQVGLTTESSGGRSIQVIRLYGLFVHVQGWFYRDNFGF